MRDVVFRGKRYLVGERDFEIFQGFMLDFYDMREQPQEYAVQEISNWLESVNFA